MTNECEILMSIRPEWITKNAAGEKTIEIRKTYPAETPPYRVYMYQTRTHKGTNRQDGLVVGEFTCPYIRHIQTTESNIREIAAESCVPIEDLIGYAGSREWLYGWAIRDVILYEEPLPLEWFNRPCEDDGPCSECLHDYVSWCNGKELCGYTVRRPPQSWMHVETKG